MYQTVTAVALRTVKYGDSRSILTAWSAQAGRLSLAMPAGNGAESRRRRALTMPLCLFEATVDVRPDREIFNARDIRAHVVLTALTANPVKLMIAQFLAEVLDVVLREAGMPDQNLWLYIYNMVRTLDALSTDAALNFHLMFLARLTQMLGIEPDASTYSPGKVFDITEGVFRTTPSLSGTSADPACTPYIYKLMHLTARHLTHYKTTNAERNALLDGLITYYTSHQYPLTNLKTLTVLRDLT